MSGFKVIIIGGGMAGCLLGNGLLRNNIDFIVYESDVEDAKREGYQIRLGAPAIEGFKACLSQDRLDQLYPMFGRSGGLMSSAPITYDIHFKPLLDLTKFPGYTKSAPINRVMIRDYLAEPISQANRIRYGKEFTGYETNKGTSGKRIIAHFADSSTDDCDLLISTEGSRSKVNKQIGLDNILQLKNHWFFLAKGTLPPSKLLKLSPEIRKAPGGAFHNGMMLFVSTYLPDGYRETPRASDGLDYDAEIASIFWSLTIPSDKIPKDGARGIPNKLQFCLDMIHDWDPRFKDILRAIDESEINVFQPRTSKKPSRGWRAKIKTENNPDLGNDRVWMLGDACHCMLPGRGMGANQAMQDTADALPEIVELARKAKQGGVTETDFRSAVRKYEDKMLPRAFGWVKASGGSGELVVPDLGGVKGWLMILVVSRLLDLSYMYSLVLRFFGFGPKDDAPELPD